MSEYGISAINTLIDAAAQSLDYASTEVGTITGVDLAKNGIYTVSVNGTSYRAYSALHDLLLDDRVLLAKSQDDMTTIKVILCKVEETENDNININDISFLSKNIKMLDSEFLAIRKDLEDGGFNKLQDRLNSIENQINTIDSTINTLQGDINTATSFEKILLQYQLVFNEIKKVILTNYWSILDKMLDTAIIDEKDLVENLTTESIKNFLQEKYSLEIQSDFNFIYDLKYDKDLSDFVESSDRLDSLLFIPSMIKGSDSVLDFSCNYFFDFFAIENTKIVPEYYICLSFLDQTKKELGYEEIPLLENSIGNLFESTFTPTQFHKQLIIPRNYLFNADNSLIAKTLNITFKIKVKNLSDWAEPLYEKIITDSRYNKGDTEQKKTESRLAVIQEYLNFPSISWWPISFTFNFGVLSNLSKLLLLPGGKIRDDTVLQDELKDIILEYGGTGRMDGEIQYLKKIYDDLDYLINKYYKGSTTLDELDKNELDQIITSAEQVKTKLEKPSVASFLDFLTSEIHSWISDFRQQLNQINSYKNSLNLNKNNVEQECSQPQLNPNSIEFQTALKEEIDDANETIGYLNQLIKTINDREEKINKIELTAYQTNLILNNNNVLNELQKPYYILNEVEDGHKSSIKFALTFFNNESDNLLDFLFVEDANGDYVKEFIYNNEINRYRKYDQDTDSGKKRYSYIGITNLKFYISLNGEEFFEDKDNQYIRILDYIGENEKLAVPLIYLKNGFIPISSSDYESYSFYAVYEIDDIEYKSNILTYMTQEEADTQAAAALGYTIQPIVANKNIFTEYNSINPNIYEAKQHLGQLGLYRAGAAVKKEEISSISWEVPENKSQIWLFTNEEEREKQTGPVWKLENSNPSIGFQFFDRFVFPRTKISCKVTLPNGQILKMRQYIDLNYEPVLFDNNYNISYRIADHKYPILTVDLKQDTSTNPNKYILDNTSGANLDVLNYNFAVIDKKTKQILKFNKEEQCGYILSLDNSVKNKEYFSKDQNNIYSKVNSPTGNPQEKQYYEKPTLNNGEISYKINEVLLSGSSTNLNPSPMSINNYKDIIQMNSDSLENHFVTIQPGKTKEDGQLFKNTITIQCKNDNNSLSNCFQYLLDGAYKIWSGRFLIIDLSSVFSWDYNIENYSTYELCNDIARIDGKSYYINSSGDKISLSNAEIENILLYCYKDVELYNKTDDDTYNDSKVYYQFKRVNSPVQNMINGYYIQSNNKYQQATSFNNNTVYYTKEKYDQASGIEFNKNNLYESELCYRKFNSNNQGLDIYYAIPVAIQENINLQETLYYERNGDYYVAVNHKYPKSNTQYYMISPMINIQEYYYKETTDVKKISGKRYYTKTGQTYSLITNMPSDAVPSEYSVSNQSVTVYEPIRVLYEKTLPAQPNEAESFNKNTFIVIGNGTKTFGRSELKINDEGSFLKKKDWTFTKSIEFYGGFYKKFALEQWGNGSNTPPLDLLNIINDMHELEPNAKVNDSSVIDFLEDYNSSDIIWKIKDDKEDSTKKLLNFPKILLSKESSPLRATSSTSYIDQYGNILNADSIVAYGTRNLTSAMNAPLNTLMSQMQFFNQYYNQLDAAIDVQAQRLWDSLFIPRFHEIESKLSGGKKINQSPFWLSSPFQGDVFLPNCTCYAWGRYAEVAARGSLDQERVKFGLSKATGLCTNDAGKWFNNSSQKFIRKTPEEFNNDPDKRKYLGAVMCWEGGIKNCGHVGIVESIEDTAGYTVIKFSQSGYFTLKGTGRLMKDTGIASQPSNYRLGFSLKFQGFILQ